MKRGNRVLIIACGILAAFVIGLYIDIHIVSGLDSPLSVVMSSSMQHDPNSSSIGVIDTGDVVIVSDPSRVEIQSYVEALSTGYKSFGDYGSVIIYNRSGDVNPVIHRAIVWIEYNGDGTWSIPSLKDYGDDFWTCSGSTDCYSLKGTLIFNDITQSHKNVKIYLDTIGKNSGYLTMGDNPVTNKEFDQMGIISHPVGIDDIRSVAVQEIPWLGVVKVFMTRDKQANLQHVPNSVCSMIMLFFMIFSLIYCCDFMYQRKELKDKQRRFERLREY